MTLRIIAFSIFMKKLCPITVVTWFQMFLVWCMIKSGIDCKTQQDLNRIQMYVLDFLLKTIVLWELHCVGALALFSRCYRNPLYLQAIGLNDWIVFVSDVYFVVAMLSQSVSVTHFQYQPGDVIWSLFDVANTLTGNLRC